MGFVLKDAPASQLAIAIRQVAAGRRVVDPTLALDALSEGPNPLSDREREVLVASTDRPPSRTSPGHDPQRGHRSQPPVGGDPEGRRAQSSRGCPHRARQGLARPRRGALDEEARSGFDRPRMLSLPPLIERVLGVACSATRPHLRFHNSHGHRHVLSSHPRRRAARTRRQEGRLAASQRSPAGGRVRSRPGVDERQHRQPRLRAAPSP